MLNPQSKTKNKKQTPPRKTVSDASHHAALSLQGKRNNEPVSTEINLQRLILIHAMSSKLSADRITAVVGGNVIYIENIVYKVTQHPGQFILSIFNMN